MKRVAWRVFFVGLLLNAAAMAQSQTADSLGDVARANHAKQQAQEAAGTTPKIITNQDLPLDPSGVPESSEPMTMVSGVQTRIDRANESMHAAVGTAQYETPVSRYQSIRMERLSHMQEMLDQQQRRLAMMQDAARLTGMGQ
jgi:hypothetical protein